MFLKTTRIFWLTLFIFCMSACSSEESVENNIEYIDSVPELKLLFSESSEISRYSQIFVFNGKEPEADRFHHKVLNVRQTPDYLKMNIPVGLWNFVLVSSIGDDIRSKIIPPAFSTPKSKAIMWTTQPKQGVLPDVPEIVTASLNGVLIEEGMVRSSNAEFSRNVAKIRVVLKDGIGFKQGDGHSFSLKNVPTSLSWNGSLYPSKDNPVVSEFAMTKQVSLFPSSVSGHQQSDTVDFIIPAHKSLFENDTTSHKITLGIKFTTIGSLPFEKEVVVNTVPKDNKVLLLNLTAKGAVELKVEVQDWKKVSSTENLKMYEMLLAANDGKMASYTMNMMQERNWWLTLDDTENFEFADGTLAFGQYTPEPVTIQIKSKSGGNPKSTYLNLFISGFDGLVQKYLVSELTQ